MNKNTLEGKGLNTYDKAYSWGLCNQILNSVRKPAGIPVVPANNNPYKKSPNVQGGKGLTKQELNEYLDLKAEQEQLEAEIKEFYDSCIKSTMLISMSKGSTHTDLTTIFAEKAARLNTKLLVKKYDVVVALEAIEDAIDKLNPKTRRIMREYYISYPAL